MTVAELIKLLKKVKDKEMSVFVDGYEAGAMNAVFAGIAKFELNVHTEHYYGEHEAKSPSYPNANHEAFYVSGGQYSPEE